MAVIGAIAVSWIFDLSLHGVSILGPVPSGVPDIGFPSGVTWSDASGLFATALSMFLVILAQSAATSRVYAVKYQERFIENDDLVGLSAANLTAGLSGTFIVNGSPTKTEMVDEAKSHTQPAQLTTAAVVLIVLLFLTKPLQYLPNAVLSAVVFLIGLKLIDIANMREIWRLRKDEFWVAAITATVVVCVGVKQGIVLAILLSLILHATCAQRVPATPARFRQALLLGSPAMSLETVLAASRAFAARDLRPVALAYDESEEFPRDLLDRAAALGLTCYDLPAAYGGGGLERLEGQIQVIEELTWGDSPIALVIAQGGFFAAPVLSLGTEEQKRRWLPQICAAQPPVCAVAITEPGAGSDAAAIETRAARVEGGYMLDGHKKFIGNAPLVDLCVVFATVEPGTRARGITAFVVEKGDEGLVIGPRLPKMGSRCFPAGELRFESLFVSDDRRLGGEGEAFPGLLLVFDRARVQLAANSLGIGRAALEEAVGYAKKRHAFRRPISDFQAVSFRLADVKLRLDQARLLARHAARLADEGKPFSTEAAMAKLAASEAAVFATSAAMQTLAGAGYIRDSLVQKWYRDAKLDEIWDGTSDIMRLVISRSLFD